MMDPLDENERRKKSLLDNLELDQSSVTAPPLQAESFAPTGGVLDAPAAPASFQRNSTRLMEGDAGKLANVEHAAKSPKYDFLQLANQGKYGYDQLGDMLGELQKGPNAQHWQGWTADKDKLRYSGDPNALGSQWGGVTEVDAIGGFNSGNPQGFRWGADDAGTLAAPEGQSMPSSQFAPTITGPLDQQLAGDPFAAIQAALAKYGQGNRPSMDALLAQLG